MEKQTARSISTEEMAVRIREELDDFYNDGLISPTTFNKKKQYRNIIRAINHADRIIARDMNLTGSVIVFVPADTANVIFSENHLYAGDYFDDINAQKADIINRDRNYFLGKDQYLDVIAIQDRFLYVYTDYPINNPQTTSRIKKLSEEDFMGIENRTRNIDTGYWAEPYFEDVREEDAYCYFVPDEGRLVMSKMFKTPNFLKFRARLMPGVVNMSDLTDNEKDQEQWSVYESKSPHWAFELMISEALLWLIPRSSADARQLVQRDRDREKVSFEQSKPGDSNVIVPHHSWG